LLLIVWVYLHSNFCGGLRKTHLFCNRMRIDYSRSSKVVDFGTNRKRVCEFLLVIYSNFGSMLPPLGRVRKYCRFPAEKSHPTSISPEFRLPMLWFRGAKTHVINFEAVVKMAACFFYHVLEISYF